MTADAGPIDVFGATLSRRGLLKAGGCLAVGFAILGPGRAIAAPSPMPGGTLDPSRPGSWVEIHADNTITIRCGKPDFGQGTPYTAFRQIVAEELHTTFEAITTVHEGSTDTTPDGSGAFNFLWNGQPNIRKAAAYTYQALLELGSRHLGVPKERLAARDGSFVADGAAVSYGELVARQDLDFVIPVMGNLHDKIGLLVTGSPPTKPVGEYTVIGRSFRNSMIAEKVAAKAEWAPDARLPGMLHARMVPPRTLGSELISAGSLDPAAYPNSRVIVLGNRVGVVATTEWEAIGAAEHVANGTEWSDWKGLPTSDRLFDDLRTADWSSTPMMRSGRSKGDAETALAGAHRTLSSSYEVPYAKHAPIGPAMALADVRSDGTVTVYASSQGPQQLRTRIAQMLEVDVGKVVIRNLPGAGQFGRSNGGAGGAEDDAAMLSRAVGAPVRVQWMRPEDVQWSPQAAPSLADIAIGLDDRGGMTAYRAEHFMPAMNDDRPVGAVLAGLPTIDAPGPDAKATPFTTTANPILDPWIYDRVPHVEERGHGTFQLGEKASPIHVGLRSKSIRTPGQAQQNFARELAISEAAVSAGRDPLQFRLDHTTNRRLINVLQQVRQASGWDERPRRQASDTGPVVQGRGVSAIFRHSAYWACVCEVAVDRESGKVGVRRYTVAVDPGIVINPLQLKRQIEGGAVMGLSRALFDETHFDESGVTDQDWASYPIPTMADLPEITVVLLDNPAAATFGGGSEAASALAAPAIAAAFLDATGKAARRLPLRPDYVQALLKG